MKKYQLIQAPAQGWRGRVSVIAEILRHVFRPQDEPPLELQPLVEKIDEVR